MKRIFKNLWTGLLELKMFWLTWICFMLYGILLFLGFFIPAIISLIISMLNIPLFLIYESGKKKNENK